MSSLYCCHACLCLLRDDKEDRPNFILFCMILHSQQAFLAIASQSIKVEEETNNELVKQDWHGARMHLLLVEVWNHAYIEM